ncbi:MAG: tyrosine-type recombinase/integrase [Minwuiales bacterium]|nr:tyrosine-type recombinase/integrase [Minwuiales bacterium]
MPTYYKPGERRGNDTVVVRGSIDGQRYEFRCESARTKAAAQDEWDAFKRKVREDNDLASPTFDDVKAAYIEAKQPGPNDRRYLKKLSAAWIKHRKKKFGEIAIADLKPNDIAQAAAVLYPGRAAATKNRQAFAPAAAVLHFAEECELAPYRRIRKMKEPKPATRRPARGVAAKLIGGSEGIQREFLIFLFGQGWRVTESLKQRWENTDLTARTFRVFVSKAGEWKTVHMHPDVFAVLAQRGRDEGPIWPWRDRHEVYRWLKPLRERLGVTFTPHMARHEWGSQNAEAGGKKKDAVIGSTWTSEKSVGRYETPDVEHARRIAARVQIGANRGQTGTK